MITAYASKYLDRYLNKLIKFQDTENIKVVTGIRCCGQSSLLKRMITHLREHGAAEHQIIEINPASCALNRITDKDVFAYIKERIAPQKRMYLFFYEVQCIPGWGKSDGFFADRF